MTICRDIMTTEPECCEPNMTVDKIAQTMKMKDIGPVCIVDTMDNMKLVGIVTDRDLAVKVVAEGQDPKQVQADQVMTRDPISCRSSDDVEKVLRLMEERQVRRVPVVDEGDKLVGIISQGDIAVRLNDADKTAGVVEEISKPEKAPRTH